MKSSQNFARALAGQHCALDSAMGRPVPGGANFALRSTSSLHTSSSAQATGLPTLGETGMKFNSSRWTQGGAEDGLSVFDMRGALDALEKGPDEVSTKRIHPAQLAHAARIARAQQVAGGVTIYGYKVFPDLTPGRAFMWGSIAALYVVGMSSVIIARQVGISSVDDIKSKMQTAFEPYKAALQEKAVAAKGVMTLDERPVVLEQLQDIGQSISRTLGKPKALLEDEDLENSVH